MKNIDDLHVEALWEDMDRSVVKTLNRLANEYGGRPLLYSEVLASAAFWLRLYTDSTKGNPTDSMVLAKLAAGIGPLGVAPIDKSKAN